MTEPNFYSGYRPVGIGATDCLPCQRAFAGLGSLGVIAPEVKRDLVSGAIAFTAPLAYHLTAPKKWPRGGVLVNLGAVAGLYFLSQWIWNRAQA